MTSKKSSFVIVYHRQPYEEAVENGKPVFRENKSPNGIVPALKGFFSTAKDAVWVAWKQAPASGKANLNAPCTSRIHTASMMWCACRLRRSR